MGDFELFVQRSTKGTSGGSSGASYSGSMPAATPFSPPSADPHQNMGQAQAPPLNPTQSVMTVDEEVDETMIFIEAPKVSMACPTNPIIPYKTVSLVVAF